MLLSYQAWHSCPHTFPKHSITLMCQTVFQSNGEPENPVSSWLYHLMSKPIFCKEWIKVPRNFFLFEYCFFFHEHIIWFLQILYGFLEFSCSNLVYIFLFSQHFREDCVCPAKLWLCLWGMLLIALIDVGRPSLKLDGFILWFGALSYVRLKYLSPKHALIHFSLILTMDAM